MRQLVSVIVPVYNGAAYIQEALDSIFLQDFKDIEVIVVNDGSLDTTLEKLEPYQEKITLFSQENRGIGAARNLGIKHAKGDYLAFLDADDLWMSGKLEAQMRAFKNDESLDLVFSLVEQFVSPEIQDKQFAFKPEPMAGLVAGSLLVKKETFLKVGLFEERYRFGEFIDWHARAIDQHLKMKVLDQVFLKRRLHTTNTGIVFKHERKDYLSVIKNRIDAKRQNQTTP